MLQVIIPLAALLAFSFLGSILLRTRTKPKSSDLPLPPGPKPLPIIGNLLNLPTGSIPEYQHWLKYKDIYGPVISVTVFGTRMVIIHDRQLVHELLDKNSMKTAARPDLTFAAKLCGYGEFLSFMPNNKTFRLHRKLMHHQLGTKTLVARFRDIQNIESHRLLLRIMNDPASLTKHIKTAASALILQIVYGYAVKPLSADPLVLLIEQMMDEFSLAFRPMTWAVDFLPWLRHMPEWFPGASFKRLGRQWSVNTRMVIETPYNFVRKQIARGVYRQSFVASTLNPGGSGSTELSEEYLRAVKNSAAIMYAGGADTTVSSLSSLILALTLFPEVQKKAQEEIDAVVGTDRLPGFADRENLPYVNAMVKEALRWFPITPLITTHVNDVDIDCGGYHIPKGAYLLPSLWWFLHDPETYSDPESFDPDRFLEPRNEPDPATDTFGYGRRVCPGRHLADDSLFINVSRLLAMFNVSKALDCYGNEITPVVATVPGLISHPVKYPYSIKPRSAKHADMIRSVESLHPWQEGDAAFLDFKSSVNNTA